MLHALHEAVYRAAHRQGPAWLQNVDGGKGGGEQILGVFEKRLTDNIEKLNFKQLLSPVNVKRIVEEADGYQPHLIAPEMGYRRLLMECLILFKACHPLAPECRPIHTHWPAAVHLCILEPHTSAQPQLLNKDCIHPLFHHVD